MKKRIHIFSAFVLLLVWVFALTFNPVPALADDSVMEASDQEDSLELQGSPIRHGDYEIGTTTTLTGYYDQLQDTIDHTELKFTVKEKSTVYFSFSVYFGSRDTAKSVTATVGHDVQDSTNRFVNDKQIKLTGTNNSTSFFIMLDPGVYWFMFTDDGVVADTTYILYSDYCSFIEMYRLYNPNSGEHFYTSSASERDGLVKAGWKYEGHGWFAPLKSNTPVYRLYSGTDHHYTTSAEERDGLVKAGWKYEGIGWYSDDAKGVPLYRQFNPNVQPSAPRNNSGSHNYTTSKSENDSLVKNGWHAEGIGWYGVQVMGG